jgi:hypothetical protein
MVSSRLDWHGDRVEAALREAAADGIAAATEHLLGASRARVPIEEGTLERSGAATVDRSVPRGVVSYDTPYAVRQHEELDWRHDPGRTAKYLEGPAVEESATMQAIVAAHIRRALQ